MTSTKSKIIELATKNAGISPIDLVRALGISNVAVHKHLRELVRQGVLEKRGKPPRVLYVLASNTPIPAPTSLPAEYVREIEKHFIYFTPTGEELNGVRAFQTFLERTQQDKDPIARAREYIEILNTAEQFRGRHGLIDSTQKIVNTFDRCFLDKLYYSDFYSLPKYGKTRLGQFILHGKSGQNIDLIRLIAKETGAHINSIIQQHKIQAVAFAPHSIPRKVQFLKEYKGILNLNLPEIKLTKAFSGGVPIAQKSLSKLSERLENARQTIFLSTSAIDYERILIIDDAVGSGATLNEIARKMYSEKRHLVGYAVVGSYKGFEVINEI